MDLQQTPAGVLKFQIIIGGDVIEMRPDMSRISKIVILLSLFRSRFEGFEFLPSTLSEAAGHDIFSVSGDSAHITILRNIRRRDLAERERYIYIYNIQYIVKFPNQESPRAQVRYKPCSSAARITQQISALNIHLFHNPSISLSQTLPNSHLNRQHTIPPKTPR